MRVIPAVLSLFILLPLCCAQAQVPPTNQTVTVTGSAGPVPLGESDRAIHVVEVTPDLSLLSGSLADLFRLDSSLDLQQRAPGGVQGDLSIRGSTFGQTLILLNGMRLNDAQSAHHNLDIPVPVDAIAQMEILRGTGSTQYGADALGGVVNIMPRKSSHAELLLRGGLGSFGENQERATAGGALGNISELISVNRDFSTGFRPDRDYRSLQLSSTSMLEDPLGPATVLLSLSDRPYGADQFYGNYPSWERTKGWFAAGHQNWGDNTEADVSFRRHTDLFVLFRDNPQRYTNRHADESWEASVRRTDDLPWGAKLHYGTEVFTDSLQSNNLGNHARNREAVYLAYDVRVWKRVSFNVGLRDDIYSGTKNQLSPNVSGAAWLLPWLKLRAGVSRAFRIPTFTDLYYQDPTTIGSPNLKPETAWSYEGGLDWHASHGWEGDVTVFHRRDSNVIDYVQFAPNQLFRATNFQDLAFTGVEASVQKKLGRSGKLDFRYTGLHGNRAPQPGTVSRYLFNYPVHSGVAAWQGDLGHHLIGRTRLGVLQRVGKEQYAVWDAYLSAALRGHVHPFLQFTNLTNTDYQEIPGIVQPGRSIIGGVELLWRAAKN